MSSSWTLVLGVAVILALLVGWFLGRRGRRMARADGSASPSASLATAAEDSSGEGSRTSSSQSDTIRDLQRELRSERSLLDGVASANGVSPRDFRRALARDYLHVADPYRWKHLAESVDVDAANGDSGFGDSGTEGPEPIHSDDVEVLRDMLEAKQQQLEQTRRSIGELRSKLESMLEPRRPALPPVSGEMIDLREEVAELRSQMADRAVEADRLRVEIGRRAKASSGDSVTVPALKGDQIEDVLAQLTGLQDRVLKLRSADRVD